MKIRKLQYNINYTHILSFKEEYKNAVLPYFGYENLRYGIDNENTINESIRLIFPNENFAFRCRKEGLNLVYEGEISEVMKSNNIVTIFFEIYERITKLKGFSKTIGHNIIIHAVELTKEEKVNEELKRNTYLKKNPFDGLHDFCCVYEFTSNNKDYKFQFGNFSHEDIKKFDLSPLESEYNTELIGKYGFLCEVFIKEKITTPTFTKFKTLIKDAENTIDNFISK